MKAWTLNPPTQSPGDLQHSWAQTKDVGTIGALDTIGTLTDNVLQKDKDEEDKEDVDTEEASSLDQTTADTRKRRRHRRRPHRTRDGGRAS